MNNKQTMRQAGYKYIKYSDYFRAHILEEIETGKQELWVSNKYHASYGLIYKNTHLEFISDYIPHYGISAENVKKVMLER